jgi:hypothetical protein
MLSHQSYMRAGESQNLRAQSSKFTVAQDQYFIAGIDLDLFQNFKSRRERFRKDGGLIANAVGQQVQVCDRHGDPFGESSVGPEDAHDVAMGTVAAEPARTPIAPAASEIDFTNHTPAQKFSRSVADLTDELMAGNALETHVASENLQIGGANTGEVNLDQRGPVVTPGRRVRGIKS